MKSQTRIIKNTQKKEYSLQVRHRFIFWTIWVTVLKDRSRKYVECVGKSIETRSK